MYKERAHKHIFSAKNWKKQLEETGTSYTCILFSVCTTHTSVADPHQRDADPDPCHFDGERDFDAICHFDADPDPTFHFVSDPDADPGFQAKAQNLERC